MLRLARPLSAVARRQLVSRPLAHQIRGYAERNDSMLSSDPSFKPEAPRPASAKPVVPTGPIQTTATATAPTPAGTTTIPPANVPREPPPPPPSLSSDIPPDTVVVNETSKPVPPSGVPKLESQASVPPQASPPPPPPPPPVTPPPPAPKRSRRGRVLLYLALLSALGYGGAVFFALRNDNFHDFFTEYVPFGENAVLYFEERAFHKRFPNAKSNVYRSQSAPTEEGKRVTIPHRSGLTWKPVDAEKDKGADVSQKGKHMSAVEDRNREEAKQNPADASDKEKSAAVTKAKGDAGSSAALAKKLPEKDTSKPTASTEPKPRGREAAAAKPVPIKTEPAPAAAAIPATPATPPKSDGRTPLISPVTTISPVTVPNGEEPVVQDLVKIINDLITVVNADDTATTNKYSAPMQKAKESLVAAASKISSLRDAERAAAEERIKEAHREFDEGAKKLLERIETAQREDDIKYREEFESERNKIAQQYEQRLRAEVERTQQVLEQRHKNELSEQGLKMKKQFIDDIKGLVEAEREGRLSKLTDLSSNVDNLTQLTSNWNGIIDANLATQKLQVAVDAVRSALDDSNTLHRPTPFVREMAALKLVADNDPVVDAAVAAINPAAYQKGIPSSAQLIDRFRRVASEVRKASLLPENAGIASHAASFVLSKVMFKKAGVPEGNDVESVLTRAETLLEEGDLDNAAREMNELKGWAGVLSRDWLNDVRKVLEVKQALDVIETEARLQCLRVE